MNRNDAHTMVQDQPSESKSIELRNRLMRSTPVTSQYNGAMRASRRAKKVNATSRRPNSEDDEWTMMKPEITKKRSTPAHPSSIDGSSPVSPRACSASICTCQASTPSAASARKTCNESNERRSWPRSGLATEPTGYIIHPAALSHRVLASRNLRQESLDQTGAASGSRRSPPNHFQTHYQIFVRWPAAVRSQISPQREMDKNRSVNRVDFGLSVGVRRVPVLRQHRCCPMSEMGQSRRFAMSVTLPLCARTRRDSRHRGTSRSGQNRTSTGRVLRWESWPI